MLVGFGATRVLCTASIEDGVPSFLRGTGQGWVTAEYGMLPRATHTRSAREAARGKQSGRTQEIQRLIGRSLRAVVDLKGSGRAHRHPRLRRAAGRRRHAHRRHHRRLRRAGGCRRHAAQEARARRESAARPGGGRLGGHLPRRAGARSRLCRGFERRDRHERGDELRRRRSSRCRERPKGMRFGATSSTSCSISRRKASRGCMTPSKPPAPLETAGHRHARNPGKLREFRALLAGLPFEPRAARPRSASRRPEETGATFLGERAAQGAARRRRGRGRRRSPTIRASRWMRSAARRASTPRATRARGADDAANNAKLLARARRDAAARSARARYRCALVFVTGPTIPRR